MLISEGGLIYLIRCCPELKNGYGVAKELDRLTPFYEGRYLSELAAVGTEFRQTEMLRLAPASIKKKLSYLRAACRYTQKEYGKGDVNLRLQVGMPTVKNAQHPAIRAPGARYAASGDQKNPVTAGRFLPDQKIKAPKKGLEIPRNYAVSP